MKKVVGTSILVGLLMFSAGCKGKQRGPAYGQEQEFRKQIAESRPVKEWGYSISDVRISDDGEKVLVVFALPGTNNFNEAVLAHDGFKRYKGLVFDLQRADAASREETAAREAAMREQMAAYEASSREQAAANEAYRATMMASIMAGQGIPPRPAPTNRPNVSPIPAYTSKPSSFQAGSAHIVVTLPNRYCGHREEQLSGRLMRIPEAATGKQVAEMQNGAVHTLKRVVDVQASQNFRPGLLLSQGGNGPPHGMGMMKVPPSGDLKTQNSPWIDCS